MASSFFASASSRVKSHDIAASSSQISTLQEYVTNNSLPPIEAAKQLATHTLLNNAAVKVPSAQPKIVALLQAIPTLPMLEVPDGEGKNVIELDEGDCWKELTGWANAWADDFNSYTAGFLIQSPRSESEKGEHQGEYINAHSYVAQLAATGDEALSSYGAGIERASGAIAMALEGEYNYEINSEVVFATANLEAAAEVYGLCKARHEKGFLGSSSNRKTLRHCQPDFSMQRWAFWKERLAELEKLEVLSEQARAAATKISGSIEGVQNSTA